MAYPGYQSPPPPLNRQSNFFDGVQSWLSGVPDALASVQDRVQDLVGGGTRSSTNSVDGLQRSDLHGIKTRALPGGFKPDGLSHISTKDSESDLRAQKQELEAELENDLKHLMLQRKDNLHRLDWQLAEAIEALHEDTARKANERIAQHREVIASLEEGEHEGFPKQKAYDTPPRSPSHKDLHKEDASCSGSGSGSESDGDAGVFGKLQNFGGSVVSFFQKKSGADGRQRRSDSRSTDGGGSGDDAPPQHQRNHDHHIAQFNGQEDGFGGQDPASWSTVSIPLEAHRRKADMENSDPSLMSRKRNLAPPAADHDRVPMPPGRPHSSHGGNFRSPQASFSSAGAPGGQPPRSASTRLPPPPPAGQEKGAHPRSSPQTMGSFNVKMPFQRPSAQR